MSKKTKDTIIVGLALFATFFGAGNLIFPPMLGLINGDKWWLCMLGFLITGAGLPILGVIAVAKAGGTIHHVTKYVGSGFGKVVGSLIVLTIGPILAIPRTGATTYEMAVKPLFANANPIVVSIIFFAITWLFVIRPSGVIDSIGKILTPILLVTMAVIIVKGIVTPIGTALDVGNIPAFSTGFLEGYQTMDALGSILIGGLILNALIKKGYTDDQERMHMGMKAGLIAAVGLASVYGGLLCIGALSGGAFPADVDRIQLILGLTQKLLGTALPLSIVVSMACLTTAIGLTALTGEFFQDLSKGKLPYNVLVTVIVIVSGFIANMGVTAIINFAVPILVTLYPVTIVLIILNVLDNFIKNKNIYIGGVAGALCVSILDGISALNLNIDAISYIRNAIPLGSAGFGWLIPACVGMIIANFIVTNKNKSEEVL